MFGEEPPLEIKVSKTLVGPNLGKKIVKEGSPKVSKGDGERFTQSYSIPRGEIVKEGSLKGSKEDWENHPQTPSISETKPTSPLGQDDPSRENHEPNNLLNDPTHLNRPNPLGEPSGKHRVASPKGSHPLGSSHYFSRIIPRKLWMH